MANKSAGLQEGMELLTKQFPAADHVAHDPVRFVRRYSHQEDAEVAGLIASSLAYGSVKQFSLALEKILAQLGPSPSRFLKDAQNPLPPSKIYYRMNRPRDITAFLHIISQLLKNHGSIGGLFQSLWRSHDADTGPMLNRFFEKAMAVDTSAFYGTKTKPHGLRFFFADPSTGSACKRINMFLRWMVRPDDGIDLGLWSFIPKNRLIVPLDTHIFRIARYIKFTKKKSPGWKTAKEITEAFKRFDPKDPVKYDFPLCHLGISGRCPIKISPHCCQTCPLLPGCPRGQRATKNRYKST